MHARVGDLLQLIERQEVVVPIEPALAAVHDAAILGQHPRVGVEHPRVGERREDCEKCHTGDVILGGYRFFSLARLRRLNASAMKCAAKIAGVMARPNRAGPSPPPGPRCRARPVGTKRRTAAA
jgi:hypothetical protein